MPTISVNELVPTLLCHWNVITAPEISVEGILRLVNGVGKEFSHTSWSLLIVFDPVKELTRIVIVNELKQGEAVVEIASTRTVELSESVPPATNNVVEVLEGPWLILSIKYS